MKTNTLETRLGVFVVLAVLASVLIVETLGGIEAFRSGIRITAQFESAQELKPGDRVKMAGVEVGRVETIALADSKVSVGMKLHHNAVVKEDSKAAIKFAGLMGQNYVSISFGSPGGRRVGDGAVIGSMEQPDLSAIMDKLDKAAGGIANFGNSFSGEKIDALIDPIIAFVKKNSDPLTETISNAKNVSGQIAGGKGTMGRLIYDESLYSSALTTVSNLQETASTFRSELAKVTNGQGTLGKLLTDDTLYQAATGSMTNLNSILLKVNRGEGSVGKLVNSPEFYSNAKLTLQKLDKAADNLEDTGPLSIIGIMAGQFGL